MFRQFARHLTCLSLTALLAACSQAPALRPNLALPGQLHAQTARFQARSASLPPGLQDLQQYLPLLKKIYEKEFADAIQNGKPSPELDKILEQNGPQVFQLLGQDAQARQQLYPYSDAMVIREFNKPSPADAVPPISATESQRLLQMLQPGDIILCGNDGSFIHGALYLGQGQIVHALATQPDMHDRFRGVVQEGLETYLARSERDTFVVLRPQLSAADQQRVLGYATRQTGKSYDSLFLSASDERFYCTELVWKALQQAGRKPRVYPHQVKYGWQIVSVEDFMDSPDLTTVFERNYQRPQPGRIHSY